MNWRHIKQSLIIAAGYDLTVQGAFGQSKTVTLTMYPGPGGQTLTFKTLGTGCMKRVVLVEGTQWVLALAGDSRLAGNDMAAEVRTLLDLGSAGVRVPEPFVSGNQAEILFQLKIYNPDLGTETMYPAFLQQYLPYQEMDKKGDRASFARRYIVTGGAIPPTIRTTVADLQQILARLRVREWGDFQVIYQRQTGHVYVFDPLPFNQSGRSAIPVVETWLRDIEAATQGQHHWMMPRKTPGGAWEV